MLKGIDISHYQKLMDLSSYDFVIIKASEGNGYKDPMLDAHYNNRQGKLYGFYHYARPDRGNSAVEEADWFLSLVGHHQGNCIYALDWEGNSLYYGVEWVQTWMRRVYEKTGVRPLFYSSSSEIMTGKYASIAAENYGLWVAHWNAKKPDFKDFPVWALWQYQGDPLDKDYFNGDETAWYKYCGKSEVPNITNSVKLPSLNIGDTVRVISRKDFNDVENDLWVLNSNFKVMQISGDRIVIGDGRNVTGAWHRSTVRKV